MKLPRLVWPTAVESVAAPMVHTAAVRTPAITIGAASGASTRNSRWRGVMPTPSAASRMAGGNPVRPATPLRRIGSMEYSVSAETDGRNPSAGTPTPTSALVRADSPSSSG